MGVKDMLSFIDNLWTRIKIAFDVQDPTRPTGKLFELPPSFQELDPQLKKTLTICNLFANNNQSIEQIAEYYQVPKIQIVRILIKEGFLKEQRKREHRAIRNGRRQSDGGSDLD